MAAPRDASEMMVSMAALILKDENLDITADNISKLIAAAGGNIEPYWPKLFCQALEGVDVDSLMTSVGAAPAAGAAAAAPGGAGAPAAAAEKAEEKAPEPESEEDDDMGFGLFD